MSSPSPLTLSPSGWIGSLRPGDADCELKDSRCFEAQEDEDGMSFTFPAGALKGFEYLTFDALLDGKFMVSYRMELQEGESGPTFELIFAYLPQCQARVRAPLSMVNQNVWRFEREGAWLKPRCKGDRVDLGRVDRMRLLVNRKPEGPARWWQTPVLAVKEAPEKLEEPLLPQGKLIDEMGQSTLHDWPGKSVSNDQVRDRLRKLSEESNVPRWPKAFSRYGGWVEKQFEATGYFRTEKDDERWWLVDPEGYAFWSAGCDCVRMTTAEANYEGLEDALTFVPDPQGPYGAIYGGRREAKSINYFEANLIHAFGLDRYQMEWAKLVVGMLRRVGFNSFGNWSDWKIASLAGFPYVRPMGMAFEARRSGMIFRDFPDVYHPHFEDDVREFATQLLETGTDEAMIGYFLMNEPKWGFASDTPAEGMLFNTAECHTRRRMAAFLKERHGSEGALSDRWGLPVTFDALEAGDWSTPLTAPARKDMEDFSTEMVERYFSALSERCREVDPNHLNLGVRPHSVPPDWYRKGMGSFDVFGINCYGPKVKDRSFKELTDELDIPLLVGEWHFGALDVGLPATGIGQVRTQADRGRAYRSYLEDAARHPWCVGVHWFTLYDQSALGRHDGEPYNIGFFDICNRAYEDLVEAARASHERLYEVVSGKVEPFSDDPEYLPPLFT